MKIIKKPWGHELWIAVNVSGHYCFNSNEYKEIVNNIDNQEFKNTLTKKITSLLNDYRIFDHGKI
jgi:frataxin-like iron-binding protein CyaY